MSASAPDLDAEDDELAPSLRGTIIAGFAVIIAFFGGFLGWSLFARLDNAVVAQGMLAADSHRKTVQHLEGGILRELLVKEGVSVKAGQVVALLDTTQSDAQLGQLTGQLHATQARVARLRSEQENRRQLDLPAELVAGARGDAAFEETLTAQRRLFDARWRAFDSARGVLGKRVDQLREEIVAADAQLAATTQRLALLGEELRGAEQLFSKGFERRTRVLELQRAIAEQRGRQGELRAQVARARQAIGGTEIEMHNLEDTRLAEIGREIQEARVLEADLADRIRAARDVRQRREILAPQDGTVVDIRLVTPGGVIGPGQPLMDIVPVDDDLIVEARVAPNDADSVRVGLPAQVRMTAYKRAFAPLVDAEVIYFSADMLRDQRTGDPYFLARARLSKDSVARWTNLKLAAGMPTEVLIVSGERRAIDYLLQPITERMHRAMHEE